MEQKQRKSILPEGVRVEEIEIVEDRTASSRCDQGFLRLQRLICRNRRNDGTRSREYNIDIIDRKALDAVAVVIWRRSPVTGRVEILIRENLRPVVYFRRLKEKVVKEKDSLSLAEIVAGIIENEDSGEEGIRKRAADEVYEEAGYKVDPEDIVSLGGPFFAAPGILSEKVYTVAVEAGSVEPVNPEGDGSPLEESCSIEWVDIDQVINRCVSGEIQDAKTEIGVRRLKERLLGGGAAFIAEGRLC